MRISEEPKPPKGWQRAGKLEWGRVFKGLDGEPWASTWVDGQCLDPPPHLLNRTAIQCGCTLNTEEGKYTFARDMPSGTMEDAAAWIDERLALLVEMLLDPLTSKVKPAVPVEVVKPTACATPVQSYEATVAVQGMDELLSLVRQIAQSMWKPTNPYALLESEETAKEIDYFDVEAEIEASAPKPKRKRRTKQQMLDDAAKLANGQ